MILYFSATGNCEYVAQKIAAYTKESAVSMTGIKEELILPEGETLGFVIPVYFWGLPSYVEEFIRRVRIRASGYVYAVVTYGTTTGQADHFLKKLLQKQGLHLDASFSIKTVDNWTVLFPVNDRTEIVKTLESEERQLQKVLVSIKGREHVFIERDKKPLWVCKGARYYYKKARQTKHLHAGGNCIGCGLCASGCPCDAIQMENGNPVWVKTACTMCFRCLHRCPTFAIQYDDKTQDNGQYVHPEYSENKS